MSPFSFPFSVFLFRNCAFSFNLHISEDTIPKRNKIIDDDISEEFYGRQFIYH